MHSNMTKSLVFVAVFIC